MPSIPRRLPYEGIDIWQAMAERQSFGVRTRYM